MSKDILSERMVITASPIGVVLLDTSMRISQVNDGVCAILGWRPSELLGASIKKLAAKQDHAACDEALTPLLRGEKELTSFNNNCLHRNGKPVPVEVTSTLRRSADGQPDGVLCHIVDVTARRRTERELQRQRDFTSAVVDTAGVLLIVLDASGRVVRFNGACEQATGYTREELIGQRFFDFLIAPEDVQVVGQVFAQLSSGQFPNTHENEWVAKDGSRRMIAWRNTAIVAPNGRVEHVIGTGIDVTEQRALEERVRQSEKLEAIGQLAGGVAHDFNNLLAGIMGAAELLTMRLPTDDAEHLLARQILSAGRRAADLTSKLLAFSRRQEVQHTPINVQDAIEEVCDLLRRTITPRIYVQTQHLTERAVVVGDRAQLYSAVLNLALNARDAMPDGGLMLFTTRAITVDADEAARLGAHVTPGEFVLVGLRDQGLGMDEEVRERAFEPFFTTKGRGKGTGLGLSAAHGTMVAHGGAIEMTSVLGKGTLIQFWLPLSDKEAPLLEQMDALTSGLSGGRFLVVDDEDVVRFVMREILEFLGHHVTEACSGEAAIAAYSEANPRFDGVILDMVMPGMGGRETMQALRDLDDDARVVLCTGFDPEDTDEKPDDLKPFTVLRKPFEFKSLAAVIEAMLDADETSGRQPTLPQATP